MRKLDFETIEQYKNHLVEEEKSAATIEKYIRDVAVFRIWANGREIDKRLTLEYKDNLMNSMRMQVLILLFPHSTACLNISAGTIARLRR